MAHLLIVDDEPAVTSVLGAFFERKGGHTVVRAHGGLEGVELFIQDRPDLVLLDLRMPDMSGFEVLQRIREFDPMVVIITAHGDIPVAVEAMKNGAENFLVKPVDLPQLSTVAERALEKSRLRRLNTMLRTNEFSSATTPLLGQSPIMQEVGKQMELLAASDKTPGLLIGEPGTGKGRIAQLIHSLSARGRNTFREVTCGAFPNTQALESELFGHERDAFDSAFDTKAGCFELARGGTVFLDEITDVHMELQPKILRVLDGRTIRRIGGLQDISTDVRILAATSRDLIAELGENRFREDLYYRLNIIPVYLPPLRARTREDLIGLIAQTLAEIHLDMSDAPNVVSDEALEILLMYGWPGNVRELRNVLEHALVLACGAPRVRPEHLPADVRNAWGTPVAKHAPKTLLELERDYISQMLRMHKLNRTRAAKELGISRQTLIKKIKEFGLLFRPGM
jgi:DNA-binding NtrC family response regulator